MLNHGIILEGPDGTGKTSLGAHLKREFDVPYYYGGGPPKTDAAIIACCERNLERISEPSIQDRTTFFSESIYRPAMEPEFAARCQVDLLAYQRRALELDPIIVFCCAPDGGRRATREEYETDAFTIRLHAVLPQIVSAYEILMREIQWSGARFIRYDFTRMTRDEVTSMIRTIDEFVRPVL